MLEKTEIIDHVLSEARTVLAQELKERKISPVFIPIVNAHLEGKSIDVVAQETGLSVLEVSFVLDKPEIQSFISNAFSSYGYLNRRKRADLIGRIIDKKLEEAEEYETPLSKKDIFDWVKLAHEEAKSNQSAVEKPKIQVNTQVNNNMVDLVKGVLADEDF